ICEPPGSNVICRPCWSPISGRSKVSGTPGKSSYEPSFESLKSDAGRRRISVRRHASSEVEGREYFWNASHAEERKEASPFFDAGISAFANEKSFAAESERFFETVTLGFSCIINRSSLPFEVGSGGSFLLRTPSAIL